MLKLYETHFHIHNKPVVTASPLDDPSFFWSFWKSEARARDKKSVTKENVNLRDNISEITQQQNSFAYMGCAWHPAVPKGCIFYFLSADPHKEFINTWSILPVWPVPTGSLCPHPTAPTERTSLSAPLLSHRRFHCQNTACFPETVSDMDTAPDAKLNATSALW